MTNKAANGQLIFSLAFSIREQERSLEFPLQPAKSRVLKGAEKAHHKQTKALSAHCCGSRNVKAPGLTVKEISFVFTHSPSQVAIASRCALTSILFPRR